MNNNTGIDDLGAEKLNCKVLKNNSQYSLWIHLTNETLVCASVITSSGIQCVKLWNNVRLNVGENTVKIPIEHLPKGVYLLKIKTNEKEQIIKLIN